MIPHLPLNFGTLNLRYNETGQDSISEAAFENPNLNARYPYS